MTPAIRMQRQRDARKAKGLQELRLWLSPTTVKRLDSLLNGLSRADKVTEMVFAAATEAHYSGHQWTQAEADAMLKARQKEPSQ